MQKLIFICGPAGIGKSSFCRSYGAKHPEENVQIISSDEIRKEVCGSYRNFPPNHDLTPIYLAMCQRAKALLETGKPVTVFLDTTMLTDERRSFFLHNIPPYPETDLYLLKLHDYSICFQRNKKRIKEKWVPDEVIQSMIEGYEDPTPEFAKRFTHVETIYLDN